MILVPPAVLWAVEVAVGFVLPKLRRYAHALIGAGIVGVIAVEVLKEQTDLNPRRLVALAVPLGLLGGVLILRLNVVRLFLRYLAIAPAIFAALFLFSSPVTAVVFERGAGPAKNVHVGKPDRVVLLVFDELPIESILDGTGQVDAELFPNFAALSRDSNWFRNNTTVAAFTEAALPALLTGDYPKVYGAPPVAAEHPDNLFTFLGGEYRMNVHESATHLCPSSLCAQASAGAPAENALGELLDTTYSLWTTFASPRRQSASTLNVFSDPLETGSEFVQSLEPARRPQLDFLHVMLPHQPWHLRGTGQDDEFRGTVLGLSKTWLWLSDWGAMAGRQRHLLQMQAADVVLGDVVAKLKRIGAYDESLLVVTADHGAAFTAGNSVRGVSNQNYPQILWTPLFVRTPGQAGGTIDDHAVRSIDVLPTIADVIEAKLPWKVDGRSVLGPARATGQPRLFEWFSNQIAPPEGSDYLSFPGAQGFAAALAGQASDATGPADLRLYRIGPNGALVGRRAEPLVDSSTAGPAGTLDSPDRFDDVDPQASSIPWAFVQGRLADANRAGVPLAITVNGVVAGVSETARTSAQSPGTSFWATLPPQLFERGRNEIGVYVINGTPADPRLVKVRLR